MKRKVLWLLLLLSPLLRAEFRAIDAETLRTLQSKGVPVIDIRTPREWKERGVIEGARLMMFFDERGRPHAEAWLRELTRLLPDKQRPVILYCAHANRTKAVGKWLSDNMGYEKVYELKGGIEYGWRDLGRPVVKPGR